MSVPKKAQRDENEPVIVADLERVGALVTRLDQPVDLLVSFRGTTFLLEVKANAYKARPLWCRHWDGRKLSKTEINQREFFARMRNVNAPVFCVTNSEEALAAIGAIK